MRIEIPGRFPGFLFLTGMILLGTHASLVGDEMVSIGAGDVMGIYYAASSGIAKVFNRGRSEHHQRLVTAASQGAVENINNVRDGKVAFGLAQGNMLARAMRGQAPWERGSSPRLQAVLGLHTEALTIVVAGEAAIESLSDLTGKRVNIGAPGSSDAVYVRPILMKAGLRLEDMEVWEEPSFKAPELLEEGKIDAYFYTDGHPDLSVREAASGKRKARLLPLDQAIIDEALAANPLLRAVTIPTEYYPGLDNPSGVSTLGVKVILFTREGMSEDTVYRLVKAVMTHLDLFRRQQPALADLKAAEMAAPSVIPFHPGALRYFREAGLVPKASSR